MIKNKWLQFVIHILAVIAIWTLLDLVFALITKTPYQFSFIRSLVVPAICGCSIGYLNYLRKD